MKMQRMGRFFWVVVALLSLFAGCQQAGDGGGEGRVVVRIQVGGSTVQSSRIGNIRSQPILRDGIPPEVAAIELIVTVNEAPIAGKNRLVLQ